MRVLLPCLACACAWIDDDEQRHRKAAFGTEPGNTDPGDTDDVVDTPTETGSPVRPSGPFGPADADLVVVAGIGDSHLGTAVDVGDLDADGVGDLIVGAPGLPLAGDVAGAAYVATGPFVSDLSLTGTGVEGAAPGDMLGAAVVIGHDPLSGVLGGIAVGAPFAAAGAGQVSFYDSKDGVLDASEPVFVLTGPPGALAGAALDHGVNADGNIVLAVGEPRIGPDRDSGRVRVVPLVSPGQTLATLLGRAGTCAGVALVFGQVIGNATDELLVGAACNDFALPDTGRAYLLEGIPDAPVNLDAAARTRFTTSEPIALGRGATLGDLDGSGATDVVLAAPGRAEGPALDAGAAYVFADPPPGDVVLADARTAVLGAVADRALHAVSADGDFDGDGATDLVVGGAGDGAGAALLFYGPLASGTVLATDADFSVLGADGDGVGIGVRLAGDVTGDGADDLLVGMARGPLDARDGALLIFAGSGP